MGGGSQSLYFNTSNNRITNAGYAYDAAGNLTNDTIHTYGFDAENKIKTVDGVSGVYSYDGDGNRVRKNFAAGEKARMVYSLRQLIAEYDLSNGALKKEYVYGAKGLIATIEPTSGTRYTTTDHLGSPRVVTNSSAGVVSRHDYMPFGVELGAGTGGRTTGMGFSVADGLRQKFTQKERDNETGLDYFLARYYSSGQGRFISPDKPFADQFQANPQSWNTYSYVRNRPCNNIDARGRCSAPSGLKPGQVGICIEAFIAKRLFKGIALGDNRTFSGDNKDLTARFKTHMIVSQAPDDPRKVSISQTTAAGVSHVLAPVITAKGPIISAQGTAETTLNGVKSGSDGTSQTTATVDGAGISRFNVSTNAENGFKDIVDVGTISTSINFEADLKNTTVKIDGGSDATGYPSMAVYSYAYVDGKIKSTLVWKQQEASPDALKEARKPIPDQTLKNQ